MALPQLPFFDHLRNKVKTVVFRSFDAMASAYPPINSGCTLMNSNNETTYSMILVLLDPTVPPSHMPFSKRL